LGKKNKWVYCKHFYHVSRYLWKVDYTMDMFIHAPTLSYNEVMLVLKLVIVAKLKPN
jgi:hypothetical protein